MGSHSFLFLYFITKISVQIQNCNFPTHLLTSPHLRRRRVRNQSAGSSPRRPTSCWSTSRRPTWQVLTFWPIRGRVSWFVGFLLVGVVVSNLNKRSMGSWFPLVGVIAYLTNRILVCSLLLASYLSLPRGEISSLAPTFYSTTQWSWSAPEALWEMRS